MRRDEFLVQSWCVHRRGGGGESPEERGFSSREFRELGTWGPGWKLRIAKTGSAEHLLFDRSPSVIQKSAPFSGDLLALEAAPPQQLAPYVHWKARLPPCTQTPALAKRLGWIKRSFTWDYHWGKPLKDDLREKLPWALKGVRNMRAERRFGSGATTGALFEQSIKQGLLLGR